MDRVRAAVRWWFTEPATGRLVLGQAPNPALVVALGATLVRWSGLLGADAEVPLRWAATGAWVVWALDELLRGTTPFRRLLGLLVLGWQATGLGPVGS